MRSKFLIFLLSLFNCHIICDAVGSDTVIVSNFNIDSDISKIEQLLVNSEEVDNKNDLSETKTQDKKKFEQSNENDQIDFSKLKLPDNFHKNNNSINNNELTNEKDNKSHKIQVKNNAEQANINSANDLEKSNANEPNSVVDTQNEKHHIDEEYKKNASIENKILNENKNSTTSNSLEDEKLPKNLTKKPEIPNDYSELPNLVSEVKNIPLITPLENIANIYNTDGKIHQNNDLKLNKSINSANVKENTNDNINTENTENIENVPNIEISEIKKKFIDEEIKLLLSPDVEIIDGHLQNKAKFDLMDFYSYVRLFRKYEDKIKSYPKERLINDFEKYHDNKNYTNEELANVFIKVKSYIELGDLNKLIIYLDNYPVINFVDNSGNNLLHYAVKVNNYQISKLLIQKGINLDKKNNSNKTPLDIANSNKNSKIAQLIKYSQS